MQEVQLHRGLRDVYLDKTEASFIDGQEGKLLYRGYNIHDLAQKSTAEETMYLLLYGKLPVRNELDEFTAQLKNARNIPDGIIQIIHMVKGAHPMDVLRTAVSGLSAFDPETEDNSLEATLRKGIRLCAQVPTVVAAIGRIRDGKEPVAPNPGLNHAANFLYMLFGEEPDADETRLMDIDAIVHAEHGSNASSFAARVAAGTLADLHCAVVAGISTLKGPLHGGAAEKVMDMAQAIGTPDRAEEYVRNVLDRGGKIMGFGHAVYRALDPRSVHMRKGCQALSEKIGQPQWFQILSKVEDAMIPYREKGIYPNVDFWSGATYHLMKIPEDLFIPIFAMSRIAGWTLQVLEQLADNRLIRPLLLYEGPMDVAYVPIEQR